MGKKLERPEIGTVCAAPFADVLYYRDRVIVVESPT